MAMATPKDGPACSHAIAPSHSHGHACRSLRPAATPSETPKPSKQTAHGANKGRSRPESEARHENILIMLEADRWEIVADQEIQRLIYTKHKYEINNPLLQALKHKLTLHMPTYPNQPEQALIPI